MLLNECIYNIYKASLPTQNNTNVVKTQTDMPQMEFETTIPLFEWAKIFRALNRVATVICITIHYEPDLNVIINFV
jgi:hypothetical protein